MSPEDRKARSEALLKERGIPVLDSLPCVESEAEVTIRGLEEVGKRIICLFCLSGTGFEPEDSTFIEYLREHDFWQYLSPEEASYLRPITEIMDASDLMYRMHWATREYGEKVNIYDEVVQEWHHAVNWLTNYDGQEWDWVATDT